MLPQATAGRVKGVQIYKSLCNLNDALEFVEQDENGIKMKVFTKYLGGEFPFDVGYVLISKYDDRKFLVTKIDPVNQCLWLGVWEGWPLGADKSIKHLLGLFQVGFYPFMVSGISFIGIDC